MRTRLQRPRCSSRWHLDEVFIRIGGKLYYLWRAVDNEGEVLDILLQSKRNRKSALKLMRKLLKRQSFLPDAIVTDRLRSYRAGLEELGFANRQKTADDGYRLSGASGP
jgi:transposase-like protein